MDNKNNIKNLNTIEDDFEKIFSIIELDDLKLDDYKILFNYLVNHSNPIREAVAYKLENISLESIDDDMINTLVMALCDINPNVARSICVFLKNNPEIAKKTEYKIILKIQNYLDELGKEKFENNKNHAKNKKLFSLYWLLEGLYYCISNNFEDEIVKILNVTIKFCDYTIREKTAKILTVLKNPPKELLEIAQNDKNFYVNFYIKKSSLC